MNGTGVHIVFKLNNSNASTIYCVLFFSSNSHKCSQGVQVRPGQKKI